jgi:hypothetical protein
MYFSRWYHQMPRDLRKPFSIRRAAMSKQTVNKSLMTHYMEDQRCVVCDSQCRGGLCQDCIGDEQRTVGVLTQRMHDVKGQMASVERLCVHCTGCREGARLCSSIECPTYFVRRRLEEECRAGDSIRWGLDLAPKTLEW